MVNKLKCKHIKKTWCLNCQDWFQGGSWSRLDCDESGHQTIEKCVKCKDYFDSLDTKS